MIIGNNNHNIENIKIPSNLEFLHYGSGSHPSDNYLIYDDNNMQIKSGDTFISWGNGIVWCINGHKYAVSYGSGVTNQIIDITTNGYTFNAASSACWVFKIK